MNNDHPTQLIAYHGKKSVKDKYVKRMEDHIKADELIRGTGWDSESGKGCAVGCTLNRYDVNCYPNELGLPVWLGKLEDVLYEGMSVKRSKTFPLEFLKVIKEGARVDDKVLYKFLIFSLDETKKIVDLQYKDVITNIEKVSDLLFKRVIGETVEDKEFEAAAWAAEAAEAAAWAAEAAEAARAARAAAWAAEAAETAAWAAEAAEAARAAEAAEAARAAARAARAAAFDKMADKLIELLKESKA